MGGDSKHIVMLPFMAQGHLIPFLQLAMRILQTKTTSNTPFTITILSSPLNIKYLRSFLNQQQDDGTTASSNSRLFLVELPFCTEDHGLPPNVENTNVIPLPLVIKLFHASAALEAPVRCFISEEIVGKEGRPPVCVIADTFLGWGIEVARSFGSVGVSFATGGLYGTAAYISLWNDLPHKHCKEDQDEFIVPGFPDNHRFRLSFLHPYLQAADGTDEWSRFFQPQIRMSMSAAGWLCNAVEEMEPLGMSLLTKYVNLPVWPIGPLLPQAMLSESQKLDGDSQMSSEDWFEFLKAQTPDSVLYISFGSQNTITPTQMMELAMGLEESEKPFIWVIRPPFGFSVQDKFNDEWLPEGFEKRMTQSSRGLFLHEWAPQKNILSHESTGGFLSHCGWNSVMESLSQGVPLIGLPLAAEQSYNLKMLEEEMGVAIELTIGLRGSFNKEKAREVVNLVLDREGKGKKMKNKAVEVSKHIKGAIREEEGHRGSSVRAMDGFVQSILSASSSPSCLLDKQRQFSGR